MGYAVQSRKLPVKIFMELVRYFKAKGLSVVLLGAQRQNSKNPIMFDDYPDSDCINLIDQTTLAESISIMHGAECVVGMDSGLVYLASLTSTPIVCGYTYVDPHYRMPFKDGIQGYRFFPVEPRGACKYCSNGLAFFGVEFDKSCPLGRNYECVRTLHHEDFIAAIEKALPLKSPEEATPSDDGLAIGDKVILAVDAPHVKKTRKKTKKK